MNYDLVFEGGGAKGMAFVGAIQAFTAAGHTFDRLMGASAGAIAATLLAAGYTPSEVMEALGETRDGQPVFVGFLGASEPLTREEVLNSSLRQLLRDVNLQLVPDFVEERLDTALLEALASLPAGNALLSFSERGGLYSAQAFVTWLQEKLNSGRYGLERGSHPADAQRAFADMNLAEFEEATGVALSLIAADTSGAQMLVLNHRTAPDCPLVMAVRMSMSFPLLWHEVTWQPQWGHYRGNDITDHAIVDGGLLSNFPIELFLSDLPHVTAVMGDRRSEHVLGFLIDERKEVPGAPAATDGQKGPSFAQLATVQRVRRLIDTVTQAHDKMVIDAFSDLVVRLPAKGFGTIEFDMTDERRQALIKSAEETTAAHLVAPAAPFPEEGAKEIVVTDPQQIADDIATSMLAE